MKEEAHCCNAGTFIKKKDYIQGNGRDRVKIMKSNAAARRIKNRTNEKMIKVNQHG